MANIYNKNKMNKNKKGLTYFTLVGPIVLLLIAIFLAMVVVPMKKAPQDLEFKNTIKNIDIINNKIPSEVFFKKEETKYSIEMGKAEFAKTLGLNSDEILKRQETSSTDELLGCKINDLQLWYNEKNIEYNKENTNIQGFNQFDTCMPKFDENFETKFETFIAKEVEQNIKKGLSSDEQPKIELIFDKSTNNIETKINTFYSDETQVAKISLNYEYSIKHNLGLYPDLLITLSELIPELSEKLSTNVPLCIKGSDLDELECIKKIIKKEIDTKNPELTKSYDFEILYNDNIVNDQYYGLIIKAINKVTKKEELNFGMILKDTIPYNAIKFELKNFEGYDNIIEAIITKPKFSDKVSSYVILYSYNDFFSKQYAGYNQLINLLQKNSIPTSFKQLGLSAAGESEYFYPKDLNLDISLITTSKLSFEKEGDKEIGKIRIYQIYNPQTQKYELLEAKPLYVYIFATDKNLNYFINEDDNINKNIIAKSIFGPAPLTLNADNTIKSDQQGYENTFLFQITKYEDTKFDHYDLYITENDDDISTCQSTSTCHYFNGISKLRSKTGVFAVTTETKDSKFEQMLAYIHTSEFTNNLVLDNSKKYNVYIIPVDSFGKAVLNKIISSWYIKEIGTSEVSYYIFEKDEAGTSSLIPAKLSSVTVYDKKGPDISNSINIMGITKDNDNTLILNWNSITPGDVANLRVDITTTYNDGITPAKTETNFLVGKDGKLFTFNLNTMQSVTVSKIIPVDSAGNIPLITDYSMAKSAAYP